MATINDLKYTLGIGLGIKKNKYLVELPVQDGRKFDVLCQSAGLPVKTIATVPVYKDGRKYNMRAETDFGDTWEITVLEDSDMSLRREIDIWMLDVDSTDQNSSTLYEREIVIWQLGNNGERVYGYVLQNAYPTSMGAVDYSDSEVDSLTDFSITFTFSEFIPLI